MQQSEVTVETLIARLRQQARINDVFGGEVSSADFEALSPLWPKATAWKHIELFATAEDGVRRLEEYRYIPVDSMRPVLPVAFMFERQSDGSSQARVYSDHHLVDDRGPILPVVEDIHPWRSKDDVLFAYFSALNGNRLDDVLELFDRDGYFRHSNGEIFLGYDDLRKDFSKMMGKDGIRIGYCRFTDDGKTCAAEAYMPSGRPAVAVYERSATPGCLHAVRIYL